MLTPRRAANSSRPAENQAVRVALRFIKARPRSSWEVVLRLKRGGFGANDINSTIEQLTKIDVLNDARFARDWVRWRDRCRPSGAFLLRRELKQKGLTAEVIERIMAERETPAWREDIGLTRAETGSTDQQLAAALVFKKMVSLTPIPPLKWQRKLAGILGRRGFSGAVIAAVLPRLSALSALDQLAGEE